MNLVRVRYLELVLSSGSFSAAARAAGVSQPAISQAMKALEQELGFALFERVERERIPTAAARRLVARSRQVHDLMRDMAQGTAMPSTAAMDANPAAAIDPVLRVGLAPAAGLIYMPTIAKAVHAVSPDGLVQFEAADADDMLDALQRGTLDCVAAPLPRRYSASGIDRHFLHGSEPRIYARLGHPLSHVTSLEGLLDAGWAVSGGSGTAGHGIEVACRVRQLRSPRVLARCADYGTLMSLVAHSDLLAVLPHRALLPADHEEMVRPLDIREGLPTYEVHLFWRHQPQRRQPASRELALRAVIDALMARSWTSADRRPLGDLRL